MKGIVQDLCKFIDKVDPDLVMGHSYGGLLALKLGEQRWNLDVCALYPAPPSNLHRLSFFNLVFFWKSLLFIDHKPPFRRWSKWSRLKNHRVAKEIYEQMTPEHSWLAHELAWHLPSAGINFDRYPLERRILIVSSINDELCPLAQHQAIVQQTGAEHIITEPGHYSFFEDEAIARQIDRWALELGLARCAG